MKNALMGEIVNAIGNVSRTDQTAKTSLAQRLTLLEARVGHLEKDIHGAASAEPGGSLDALGWTREEALSTRARLANFADDWEAPEMARYDRD